MNISVSAISFSLTYELNFKEVDNPTIVPDSFGSILIQKTDLDGIKNEINSYITDYKAGNYSSYDFKVQTGVDFGLTTGEINATVQGDAKRKNDSGNIYFHNLIELDSDLKNADLYKGTIEDVKIKKTKLSNGDVYLIKKNLGIDDTKQVNGYIANENDSFYLLNVLDEINGFSFAKKIVDGNETKYQLGCSTENVLKLIKYFNEQLSLSPYENISTNAKVFGDIVDNTIMVKKSTIEIVVANAKLSSIKINLKGDITTKFTDSRDFDVNKEADFSLDYELKVTEPNLKDFPPYETVSKAK